MWNKVVDLFGYFHLLAGGLQVDTSKTGIELLPRPGNVECEGLYDLYMSWSRVRVVPRDYTPIPYELLSPTMLLKLAPD
jgi:hypothetical protein